MIKTPIGVEVESSAKECRGEVTTGEADLLRDSTRLDFLLAHMPGIYLGRPYYAELGTNSREAIDAAMAAMASKRIGDG